MADTPDKPDPNDGATTRARLNIYLDPPQLKKLSDLHATTGASVSHHVRRAVDQYDPSKKAK
jgi:hypothetical protein